jgi:vacuolar-type H+-ATPase subunit H
VSEHAHIEEPIVSSELGERVRAIVAAAEGMAAAVRDDAEQYAEERRREADEEAERRLREARERADRLVQERLLRISELSDSIVGRTEPLLEGLQEAEEVRRQLGELVRSLGDAAQRIAGEVGEVEPPQIDEDEHPMAEQVRPMRPPGEAPRPPLRPVEAPPEHEVEPRDPRLEDARLVALQMAVAGRSREEVAAHMREAYSIDDPEPILESIFNEGFTPGQG